MNKIEKFVKEHEFEINMVKFGAGMAVIGWTAGYLIGWIEHRKAINKIMPRLLEENMRCGADCLEDAIKMKVPAAAKLIDAFVALNPGELGDAFWDMVDNDVANELVELGIK